MLNHSSGHRRVLAAVLVGVASTIVLASPPRPGDYLISSRNAGSIYAIDPDSGVIRGVVSGRDLRIGGDSKVVGAGQDLAPSFRLSLDSATGGAVLARTCFNPASNGWGMFSIDHLSGDRTLLSGTDSTLWQECGDLIFDGLHAVYSTANGEFAQIPTPDRDRGRVIHYDLDTNISVLVSGDARGDGLGMYSPRAIARLDANTLLALEVNLPTGLGGGLFKIDIPTGDRTLLSWITSVPRERRMIIGGVDTGPVTIGDDEGGSGPTVNRQPRTVCVTPDGQILVGAASDFGATFGGAIFEIDPITGDRTLLVGDAFDQLSGERVTVLPSNDPGFGVIDAPIALINTHDGLVAFTQLFDENRILELDPATRALTVAAELSDQLAFPNNQFSGLTIYWPDFDPGDLAEPFGINDFDDVLAFLTAFAAQDPIADSAPPEGVYDFDDVLAFLVAFAGG